MGAVFGWIVRASAGAAGSGEAAMEAVDTVVRPVKDFAKDSIRLVKRCHKPDRRGTWPCLWGFRVRV